MGNQSGAQNGLAAGADWQARSQTRPDLRAVVLAALGHGEVVGRIQCRRDARQGLPAEFAAGEVIEAAFSVVGVH